MTGALQKAKGSLILARGTAAGMFVPPDLQTRLDRMSGAILADDKDFTSAYSYFYEALETLAAMPAARDPTSSEARQARDSLCQMIACKMLAGSAKEIPQVLATKTAQRFIDETSTALVELAAAHADSDLARFAACASKNLDRFAKSGSVVSSGVARVHQELAERDVIAKLEPYSRIEISEVAALTGISQADILPRLTTMILDGKLAAVIDEETGTLVLESAGPTAATPAQQTALRLVGHLGAVADALQEKSTLLHLL
jgi:26S proteasome regulatory subunit N6